MAPRATSPPDAPPPARLWLLPALTVVAASIFSLVPYVAAVPVLPPFGLVVLLGWRLLRPELWGAWVALPLGLIDDLIGGAPLGSAMTIWTIVLLGLDLADHYAPWRDFRADWTLAVLALAFAVPATWAIARLTGGAGPFWTAVAQGAVAALLFPAAGRLCLAVDRRRLGAARAG